MKALHLHPTPFIDVTGVQLVTPSHRLTIEEGSELYKAEWMKRKGQDPRRFGYCMRHIFDFFGRDADPEKIKTEDWKRYEDFRYAAGVCEPTVKKEMRMYMAAMNHNKKRGRILGIPFIEMPDGQGEERRPMREDEYRLLMRSPLLHRQRMFWRVKYFTGHRSRRIELLPWTRVFWDTLTINFNEPGARKTNKRCADGFPIEPEFESLLRAAKERRDERFPDDPYVIGLNSRGNPGITFRQCKRDLAAVGIVERGFARHCVRKLFCTSRIANGKSGALVAALIADDERTMKRHYVKLSSDEMRDAARNTKA